MTIICDYRFVLHKSLGVITGVIIAACSTSPVSIPITASYTPKVEASHSPIPSTSVPPNVTPSATPSATPTFTPQPSITPPPLQATEIPGLRICSPLNIPLERLPENVSNPFLPPRKGSDDTHHGVDFAYFRDGELITLNGSPVMALLEGQVTIIIDRFPYGNAIMIETPLERFPPGWLSELDLPSVAPAFEPNKPTLTCPKMLDGRNLDFEKRSLYTLYAHMKEPANFQKGDAVTCSQDLGAVGNSGNSIYPHLHLETRVGPAGAHFSSMAHYDSSATDEEMGNYCAWRVSGLFKMVDPMRVLGLTLD